jgi:hypothetical protein
LRPKALKLATCVSCVGEALNRGVMLLQRSSMEIGLQPSAFVRVVLAIMSKPTEAKI